MQTSLQQFIKQVKTIPTQREAVEYVYNFLGQKYYGDRIKWFTYFHYIFQHIDLEKMRETGGAVQCMQLNRLFQYILVQSGHFSDNAIQLKRTFPHQYVHLTYSDGTQTYVDIRGKNYGIPLGDYSRIFRSKEK